MTKRYYLSKEPHGPWYVLDTGGNFGKNRIELTNDKDFLIFEVKSRLDKGWKKRKTDFYVVEDNLSKESIRDIRRLFSDSKVKVSLASRASVS